MANKMLIDATHPEETRVVVLRGNRVEEFDFESAQRKQLRGNIYLAKVTRVEPSLQAAFVDYGGNRHGFLAFSEIHPDYYQIPVADRQALIDEEGRAQRAAEDEDDRRSRRHRGRGRPAAHRDDEVVRGDPVEPAPVEEAPTEERTEEQAEAGEAPTIAQSFVETEADEAAVEAEDTEGPTTLPEEQLLSALTPPGASEGVEPHSRRSAGASRSDVGRADRRAVRTDRRADGGRRTRSRSWRRNRRCRECERSGRRGGAARPRRHRRGPGS